MKRKKPLRRGKLKKKSANASKAHKARAWKVFSELIRKRDCLRTTATLDTCICATCEERTEYGAGLHAGHFTDGRHNSVLFDERNVHGQCRTCNMFRSGDKIRYTLYMQARYGDSVIGEILATNNEIRRFTADELDEMMAGWRVRIGQMEEAATR